LESKEEVDSLIAALEEARCIVSQLFKNKANGNSKLVQTDQILAQI
jgi:hypothetical protein